MYFDTLCLRNGDRVVIDGNSETDSMGVPQYAGREGMIVGFGMRAFGRTRCFGVKPGVYRDLSMPHIVFDDESGGASYPVPARYVRLADPVRQDLRLRMALLVPDSAWRAHVERNYLRKLPETPFWEDDLVLVRSVSGRILHRTVVAIDHDALAAAEDDSTVRAYAVAEHRADLPIEWVWYAAAELSLVKRGNVHRMHHGDLLVFHTEDVVAEELSFAVAVGTYDVLPPPQGHASRHVWGKHAVVDALKRGVIDWVLEERVTKDSIFPPELRPPIRRFGVRFFDQELGAKLNLRARRALAR